MDVQHGVLLRDTLRATRAWQGLPGTKAWEIRKFMEKMLISVVFSWTVTPKVVIEWRFHRGFLVPKVNPTNVNIQKAIIEMHGFS